MPYLDDLALAQRLADAVDTLTVAGWQGSFGVELKADDTPVTAIDREAELLIRAELAAARPEDGIVGEEYGTSAGGSGRRWVVDPIDGTKNFLRGVPAWATLIALIDGDEPVVGVVSAPALGRRWWAASGEGAWARVTLPGFPAEPKQIHVSDVGRLADASLSISSLSGWEERGSLDGMLALTRAVWRVRAFGDFWSYMLVAEGTVDIAAEPELALHDMAALVPIVTEAGGSFTSLAGKPGPWGGNAIASNARLHAEALAHIGE